MKLYGPFSNAVKKSAATLITLLLPAACLSQPGSVDVTLDPSCVRNIGGVTTFDRNQFITVHESFGSTDMSNEDALYLENELEARYGRDGGLISWQAGETKADPDHPDMPDVNHIREMAAAYRATYQGPRVENPEHLREVVLCTHPEQMHAMPGNQSAEWGPRTYEAAAEYTAQMMKYYFSDNERPKYLEVFNEPFIKTDRIGTTVEAMSEQHNVVAKRVKELNPEVLVGGYSAAWADLEARNFEHWEGWQKKFMDIAGENMDFFSYHIYDGVNVKGIPSIRTGSNSEAIMDMIDTYSHISFGEAKPLLVTEYGGIPRGNMGSMTYSAERSADMLYSFNGQLMTFMDHPDRLLKAIPFILGKALWTYGMVGDVGPDEANPFLLWRRLEDGTFVETDLMLFYRFWKGVSGEWRGSDSSNPDVRVQFLVDKTRLTVALMNLDGASKTANISGLDKFDAGAVSLRSLKTRLDVPLLTEVKLDEVPAELSLAPGEAALLLIDLEKPIEPTSGIREHRVYATEYLKDIHADQPMRFKFKDTPTGSGRAVLRVSPGRKQGLQVLPSSVEFNGQKLPIPANWAGDEQAGRGNFFGMIEFEVPMALVKTENHATITYPDSGGKVACAVLQVNRKKEIR